MPVITIANSKGGTGKTTLTLALSQVLSHRGLTTTILEADPNRPISEWLALRKNVLPSHLTITTGVNENTFMDQVNHAKATSEWVIIDLEGTKNIVTAYAVALADLVLIPLQGSQLDADQAASIIKLINDQAAVIKRQIPFSMIFTRTSALQPRDLRHIRDSFTDVGIDVLPVELTDRAAFRTIMQTGDTLYSLKPADVRNPQAAIDNAEAITDAIMAQFVMEAAQ